MTSVRAATWYARRGFYVFPVAVRGKTPAIPKSRGGNGCKDATADLAVIMKWWNAAPYNIGIECGRSGLLLLDVDPDKGGWQSLAKLENEHGALPVTPTVETSGGGAHLYFRAPATPTRNSAGTVLGDGLDTRAAGGYVCAPPSVHPSGHLYRWRAGRGIHEIELAPLPGWLAERLRPPPPPERKPIVFGSSVSSKRAGYARAALFGECDRVMKAPRGRRNGELFKAACNLGEIVAAGLLDERMARGGLIQTGVNSGLSARESLLTVNSGMDRGMRNPRQVEDLAHG